MLYEVYEYKIRNMRYTNIYLKYGVYECEVYRLHNQNKVNEIEVCHEE